MISRGGLRLRVAVAVVALALGAVAVNIGRYGSFNGNVFEMAFTMVALAALLVLGGTPITALVCFWKGRPLMGWGAAATLPAVAVVFGVGVAWGRSQETSIDDFGAALLFGVFVLLLTAAVGGGLAIPSWVGALQLAHPDSTWARRWYDADRMAAARANHAEREGTVLPLPPLPPPPTDAGD